MHEFTITPAHSIGPIQLGMNRAASRDSLEAYFGGTDSLHADGKCDYYFDNAFQVYFTPEDHVDWIQVCPHLSFQVMLLEKDVANTPANQLIRHLCDTVGQDIAFNARDNYSFPSLQLFLWDADEQYDVHGKDRLIYGAVGIDSRPFDPAGPVVTTY